MDNPLVNESHLPWHFLHSYVKAINDHLGTHVRLQTGKPELYLSDDEKAWQPKYKGYWLVCQPGAKKDYTVKYWPHEYLQDVVDRLRGRVQFVQVGSAEHNHKPLRGVIDEIGKTDLRQLIRMAYHADGALTGESFLHHVMAAFSKPCVTVASGWLSKQWVNYPTCTLLSRHGCLPCCRDRACGQTRVVDLGDGDEKSRKLCHFPVLSFPEPVAKCMAMIGPDEVVRAIENYLEGERCSIYYTSSNTV
jgi:ADP-heptose:LPS heptosyltransferase